MWEYLMSKKKLWLTPVLVLLVLLAAIFFLTQGSALAPFIYNRF